MFDRSADRLAQHLEMVAAASPTAAELFHEWVDRLIDGGSSETVEREMTHVLRLYRERGRRSADR